MIQTYVFREVHDKEELKTLFKLRYDIFSKCHMALFLRKNHQELDVLPFDTSAVQYGLFLEEKLIGSIRVVKPVGQYINTNVQLIYGDLYGGTDNSSHHPGNTISLPFLDYGRDISDHWQFYNSCADTKQDIVEGGRLAILPEYRNIRVSKFLIESVFATYFVLEDKYKHAVVSSTIDHAPFYRHYGFKAIGPENGYQIRGNTMVTFSIPIGTLEAVPHHLHDRFIHLANTYSSTGQIECQI
jgi:predicted GNAT family N-acyltransferase